jgi:hypothetical protein
MWVTSAASRRTWTGALSPCTGSSPSSVGKLRQTYSDSAASASNSKAPSAHKDFFHMVTSLVR